MGGITTGALRRAGIEKAGGWVGRRFWSSGSTFLGWEVDEICGKFFNSAIFLADGFKITLEIFFFYYPYSVLLCVIYTGREPYRK